MMFLIALIFSLAYFVTGLLIARHDLPESWRQARCRWAREDRRRVRSLVKSRFAATACWWPFIVGYRAGRHGFDHVIDSGDPQRPEREREAKAKRLAELEREAGLAGSDDDGITYWSRSPVCGTCGLRHRDIPTYHSGGVVSATVRERCCGECVGECARGYYGPPRRNSEEDA